MRLFRRVAVLGSLLLSLVVISPGAAIPALAASCDAVLGFKMLQQTIPAIVGDCTGQPYIDARTGDIIQPTTRGTLVRKGNNAWPYFWVHFTDGSTTYVNGPRGVQSRPNDQPFAWESNPIPQ